MCFFSLTIIISFLPSSIITSTADVICAFFSRAKDNKIRSSLYFNDWLFKCVGRRALFPWERYFLWPWNQYMSWHCKR